MASLEELKPGVHVKGQQIWVKIFAGLKVSSLSIRSASPLGTHNGGRSRMSKCRVALAQLVGSRRSKMIRQSPTHHVTTLANLETMPGLTFTILSASALVPSSIELRLVGT